MEEDFPGISCFNELIYFHPFLLTVFFFRFVAYSVAIMLIRMVGKLIHVASYGLAEYVKSVLQTQLENI